MLKVGYDAEALLSPNGGLGKGAQLRNLLGPYIECFTGFATCAPNLAGMRLIQEGHFKHRLWQQLSLPRILKRHKIDLFLAPENTAPFFMPSSVRLVLVLHDTILLEGFRHAGFKAWVINAYQKKQVAASVSRAELVLTVSEHSRSEILRFFPGSNIRVIPCTIQKEWFDPGPMESREDYLLLVTSAAPHKNARGAIQGYAHYARSAGKAAYPLNIVGLPRHIDRYLPLLDECGIRRCVSFMPFLTERELRSLYRKALAAIVPSFAEGFGMPLLEAMATGTPVLASNLTSLPEVGGSAPFYFDPHKPAEIGTALSVVMADPSLRHSMSLRGLERAQEFHPSIILKLVQNLWQEIAAA
jgi:glycosyltransferase involved in cell wall biosynthesis